MDRKQKRLTVTIKTKEGQFLLRSYPKYLMECYLNRPLDPNLETIDHIDGDPLNNDLSNLRIVSRTEHAKQDVYKYVSETFNCPVCKKKFTYTAIQTKELASRKRNSSSKAGPFCSRRCSGIYGKNIQKGIWKEEDFITSYIPSLCRKKDFQKFEPFIGNNKSGVRDIGETLTGNADGNTEGTSIKEELRRD